MDIVTFMDYVNAYDVVVSFFADHYQQNRG